MRKTKVCFKCGRRKVMEEFYKHSGMADGHLGKCKGCTKEDVNVHRVNNLEKVLQYDRDRYRNDPGRRERSEASMARAWAADPERYRSYKRDWRARNKDKVNAQNKVARAIKVGTLTRGPCEKCGAKAQAHHDDYTKPLDVRWLCPKHHGEHHRKSET